MTTRSGREHDLDETISAEDAEARHDQDRDASRIHRELAEAGRLAAVIEDLLREDDAALD